MSDRKQTFIFDVQTQWDSFVAVVEVDLDEVSKLKGVVKQHKAEGLSLVDVSVWGVADLYERNEAVETWLGERGLLVDMENQFWAKAPTDPEFEKITERVRLSFSKLVATGTAVYWELAPKHAEGTVETPALYEDDLA
jgi:hypothetical protein